MPLRTATASDLGDRYFRHGFCFGGHNQTIAPCSCLMELPNVFLNIVIDLKSLMRWIVLSKPGISFSFPVVMTSGNEKDMPGSGEPPYFSRFYVRQMEPEQLYDSLMVATKTNRCRKYRSSQDRWAVACSIMAIRYHR